MSLTISPSLRRLVFCTDPALYNEASRFPVAYNVMRATRLFQTLGASGSTRECKGKRTNPQAEYAIPKNLTIRTGGSGRPLSESPETQTTPSPPDGCEPCLSHEDPGVPLLARSVFQGLRRLRHYQHGSRRNANQRWLGKVADRDAKTHPPGGLLTALLPYRTDTLYKSTRLCRRQPVGPESRSHGARHGQLPTNEWQDTRYKKHPVKRAWPHRLPVQVKYPNFVVSR